MTWPKTPEYVATGTAQFTANSVVASTTLTAAGPTREIGDLLVCVTNSRGITAACATPSGWNLVSGFPITSATASGGRIYVFTRIATSRSGTGDDASCAWTSLTTGTSGDSAGARIMSFRYCTATLDGSLATTQDQASTTTFTANAVSPSNSDSLWVAIGMKVNDTAHTFTLSNSVSEAYDAHTTTGTGHGTIIGYKVLTASGSTGTSTVTPSTTVSSRTLTTGLCFSAVTAMGNPDSIDQNTPVWTPGRRGGR